MKKKKRGSSISKPSKAEISKQKYRAPALEKGLDVLELLASTRRPMSLMQMCGDLKRSLSELFRMVQVLEFRGYVEPSSLDDGYVLTDRLFMLGMTRAPVKDVLKLAQPHMRQLALQINQSCHIAVASGDQMVVISRIESPGDLGFSVREGFRRDIVDSTSGLVLYAYQPEEVRAEWKLRLSGALTQKTWAEFEAKAAAARERGFVRMASDLTKGIVDLSAPVMHMGRVAAALTCPHVDTRHALSVDETADHVRATARKISDQLAGAIRLPQN